MWITWRHQDADFAGALTFDQKVEVFYEQTLGWQLHIADLIANGGPTFGENHEVPSVRHSGFAVLHICLSYFELIGSLVTSPGQTPTAAFKAGVRHVLPGLVSASANSEALLPTPRGSQVRVVPRRANSSRRWARSATGRKPDSHTIRRIEWW